MHRSALVVDEQKLELPSILGTLATAYAGVLEYFTRWEWVVGMGNVLRMTRKNLRVAT